VLTAETALQLSGFVGSQFTGYAHRVLMISGTLTAAEKLLCRQWCAEGNGVAVLALPANAIYDTSASAITDSSGSIIEAT